MSERAARARRGAEAGGAVALEHFRGAIDVETKDTKTDVVTQADRDAQRAVVEAIREGHPDDPIVGEEDEEASELPESGPPGSSTPSTGRTTSSGASASG